MNAIQASPADYVIQAIGGVRATARALDRTPQSVCAWKVRGLIPNDLQAAVLTLARGRGLPITAENIITGGRITVPARKEARRTWKPPP